MRLTRRTNKKSRAFTLIELLVVISIIALLVGILLPALGKARLSARQIVLLSNNRQIGIVMYAFSADNNGLSMQRRPYQGNVYGPATWRGLGGRHIYGPLLEVDGGSGNNGDGTSDNPGDWGGLGPGQYLEQGYGLEVDFFFPRATTLVSDYGQSWHTQYLAMAREAFSSLPKDDINGTVLDATQIGGSGTHTFSRQQIESDYFFRFSDYSDLSTDGQTVLEQDNDLSNAFIESANFSGSAVMATAKWWFFANNAGNEKTVNYDVLWGDGHASNFETEGSSAEGEQSWATGDVSNDNDWTKSNGAIASGPGFTYPDGSDQHGYYLFHMLDRVAGY